MDVDMVQVQSVGGMVILINSHLTKRKEHEAFAQQWDTLVG